MTLFSSSKLTGGLASIALAVAHLEGEHFAGSNFRDFNDDTTAATVIPQKGKYMNTNDEANAHVNANAPITENDAVDMTSVIKQEMLPPPPPPPSPSEIIIVVNSNDVLCGRGGETNHHPGNVQYRGLVKIHQRAYLHAKRRDKPRIARIIVDTIRRQIPHGRFLKKDTVSGAWKDVGNVKAREKTSQALREGAPEIRDLLVVPEKPNESFSHVPQSPPVTIENSQSLPQDSHIFLPVPCSSLGPRVVSASSETLSLYSSEENEQKEVIRYKQDDRNRTGIPIRTTNTPQKRKFSFTNSQNTIPPMIKSHIFEHNEGSCAQSERQHFSRGPRLRIIKARMETQQCNNTFAAHPHNRFNGIIYSG